MGLIRFSRRVLARRAVGYALANRERFVAFLDERIDIPFVDDDKEALVFGALVESSLVAIDALLGGELRAADDSLLSKRAIVAWAAQFVADNIEGFLGEGFDVPFVPEPAEVFVGEALARFFADVVVPWADTTPLLD